MQPTLAQRIVKLKEMSDKVLSMYEDEACNGKGWSDHQWDAYHVQHEQLSDAIFNYEHTPLMEC